MRFDICENLYVDVVLSGVTTIFLRDYGHTTNDLTAFTPSTMRSRLLLQFADSQTETSPLSRRTFPLCGSVVPVTFSQTETASPVSHVSCCVKVLFQLDFPSKKSQGLKYDVDIGEVFCASLSCRQVASHFPRDSSASEELTTSAPSSIIIKAVAPPWCPKRPNRWWTMHATKSSYVRVRREQAEKTEWTEYEMDSV